LREYRRAVRVPCRRRPARPDSGARGCRRPAGGVPRWRRQPGRAREDVPEAALDAAVDGPVAVSPPSGTVAGTGSENQAWWAVVPPVRGRSMARRGRRRGGAPEFAGSMGGVR